MASKRDNPRPTDAELNILRVLWAHGEATVRAVHEALGGTDAIGYTTVLKLMQIMTDKGLVRRDVRVRPQIYRAKQSREQTQKQMLRRLVEGAFGGSSAELAMRALGERDVTAAEIDELRALLDRLEEERG